MRRAWSGAGRSLPAAGLAVALSAAAALLLLRSYRPEGPAGPGGEPAFLPLRSAATPEPAREAPSAPVPVAPRPDAPLPVSPGTKGSLVVHVVSGSGGTASPVAGAILVVATRPAFAKGPVVPARRSWIGRSGEDGLARFPGLEAGYYGVLATAPGLETPGRLTEVESTGETLLELPLEPVYDPAPAVVGRALSSDGEKPLEGVEVRRDSGGPPDAVTDEAGRFRLESGTLRRGNDLTFSRKGLVTTRAAPGQESTADGAVHLEVRLDPAGSLSGVIRDTAGRPIGGARVSALEVEGSQGGGFSSWIPCHETTAGADGEYRIDSLVAGGVYRLWVTGPSNLEPSDGEKQAFLPPAAPDVRVDLIARVRPVLRVRWDGGKEAAEDGPGEMSRGPDSDSSRSRAADAEVRIHSTEGGSSYQSISGRGFVEFAGLQAGKYVLVARGNAGFARTEVEVHGGIEEVALVLDPGVVIEGRVADGKGMPPEGGCWVTARTRGGIGEGWDLWRVSSETGEDGKFLLAGLEPGCEYTVETSLRCEPLVVKAPARDVLLALSPRASVKGRVVSTGEKALSQGVHVACETFVEGGGWTGQEFSGCADPGGRFEIRDISPARVRVRATWVGCSSAWTEAVVAEDASVDIGDLMVEGGESLCGRVLDLEKRPLRGVQVQAEGVWGSGESESTGADGRFQVRGLPPGEVGLRFLADGFEHVTLTVYVPRGDSIEVFLAPTMRLSGIATDEAGVPLAGAQVSAVPFGIDGVPHGATVDFRGRFELRLPAGKYQVSALSDRPGRRDDEGRAVRTVAEAVVTMEAGKDATLDLRAPR